MLTRAKKFGSISTATETLLLLKGERGSWAKARPVVPHFAPGFSSLRGSPTLSLPTDVNIWSEWLSLTGLPTDTRPKETPNRKLIPSFKIGCFSKCGWRDKAGATQQHDTESKHQPTQHNRDTTEVQVLTGKDRNRRKCKY